MRNWVALGRDGPVLRGFAMAGEDVCAIACGTDNSAVLAKLGLETSTLVRIGAGEADALPSPVLPDSGSCVSALAQGSPPDVISGWVRLWVAGHLARHSHWDGIICALHGDVTHWLHVSADEVISSQSSLTPRLAVALGLEVDVRPDGMAMDSSLSRPERLTSDLRAAEVAGDAASALGHLMGAEMAATRAYWLGQQVTVLAKGGLGAAYASALQAQGVPVEQSDPETLLPMGLAALGRKLGYGMPDG